MSSGGAVLAVVIVGCLAALGALGVLVVLLRRGSGVPSVPPGRPEAVGLTEADTARLQAEADVHAAQLTAQAEREAAEILGKAAAAAAAAAETTRDAEAAAKAAMDEVRRLRADLERREDRLGQREQRIDELARKADERSADLDARKAELDRLDADRRAELERVAGLTAEAAKAELVAAIENQAKRDAVRIVRDIEADAQKEGGKRARKIVTLAIQRIASEQTSESVVSVLHLPGDEMKGRIIGREGRNIRAFEKATGVDVIIDDTPGVVIVSAFDVMRREVARLALSKLIADGRIHPSRIEELVASTQKELERHVQKLGEEACQEVEIHGLHERLVNLLGRLHFRTSYSQNVLRHSIEVAFIAGMLAEEMGWDGALARRAGLLHDIGKAADHEIEGGHPKIGADLLKRYNERPEVIHAASGHHDDLRIDNPYTVLVATADACSASRPGARRETLERYIKRMEELESIAASFPGVEQAFAIQAGRELRAIVSSKDTTDETAAKICRDIAKAFEQQLTYPGEIKVTVVRETRHVELAR